MGMHYSQYKRASEEAQVLFLLRFQLNRKSSFPRFLQEKKKVKALEILKRMGKKSLKVKTDRYAQIDQKKGSLRSLEHIQEVLFLTEV